MYYPRKSWYVPVHPILSVHCRNNHFHHIQQQYSSLLQELILLPQRTTVYFAEYPIHCVHRKTYRKSFSPHLLERFPKNQIFQEYVPNHHPLPECFYSIIIHPIQLPIPTLFKTSSEIQGGRRGNQ